MNWAEAFTAVGVSWAIVVGLIAVIKDGDGE